MTNKPMLSVELLPCPHCGSSVRLTTYSGAPAIFCDNSQCEAIMGGEEYMGTAEQLIENWNRRPQILQNHGQPAAWATEIGISGIEAASKTTWPSFVSVSSHRSNMDGITVPLFREQPVALKIGAGVTVQNVGFGTEEERKPYLVFGSDDCLTEVNLIDVSLVSKRQAHTIADLEAIGVRVEQPAPVAVAMPDRMKVEPFTTIDRGSKNYKAGYNAAIAEVAKLNGLNP